MNRDTLIGLAIGFSIGTLAGFLVGKFVIIEKDEPEKVYGDDIKKKIKDMEPKKEEPKVDPAETEVPQDDDPNDFVSKGPAHIAMPGQPGVNYSKVQQIIKENGYSDPEDIQEVIDDLDNQETYEERIEREQLEEEEAMSEYRKRNAGKIVPIQKDEWDTDFPEVDYEKKDLYYFTVDDVLTDEDGNIVNEEEHIGTKPRQFGWMANNEEKIYIRNNPKETDYQVWKEKCASTDWWA